MEKVVYPIKGKAQQSSTQLEELKGTAKEKKKERNVRRMFKILREVQLDIRIEKVNTHEYKSDWAQDSRRILSDITDCSQGTTHLQKNPQKLG